MSTTPNLLIAHIASSQNNKEITANTAFDDFDGTLTGTFTQAMADANQTPSADNCHYNALFLLTGALTAARNLVVPTTKKFYLVKNNTTGGFGVVVKTSGGTGIAVLASMGYVMLYCDGTNVVLISAFTTIGASVDLTGQAAAVGPTTILAVPAGQGGQYKISWSAKVTTADTTSSTLGGATGFRVGYTDTDDSVALTTPAWWGGGNNGAAPTSAAGNATSTQASGEVVVNAKAGTNIQYSFDYTSLAAPSTVAMLYSLHITVKKL